MGKSVCGPLQGNTRCRICMAWSLDGGCKEPAKCARALADLERRLAGEYESPGGYENHEAPPPYGGDAWALSAGRRDDP